MTVDDVLSQARAQGVDRLDALLLLSDVVGKPRTWLLARGEMELTSAQHKRFGQLLAMRIDQVPMAYLLGKREFHGLTLTITPDVLDPRPDTETLVDWALDVLQVQWRGVAHPKVLDMGTGSGAIALAIAYARPDAAVSGIDASADALAVAKANAQALGLAVSFKPSDWWRRVSANDRHLVVANPPYIAADDPHLPALRHEPLMALTPGGDGLAALRTIIAEAPTRLVPGGWLLLEHGHDQADAVAALLQAAGFADIAHRQDLGGHRRCTGGRWRGD